MTTPAAKDSPKNYITPAGLQLRLRDERRFLVTRERPAVTNVVAWAAGNGDRRIAFLALTLMLPLLSVVSAAIRVTSPGPVLRAAPLRPGRAARS